MLSGARFKRRRIDNQIRRRESEWPGAELSIFQTPIHTIRTAGSFQPIVKKGILITAQLRVEGPPRPTLSQF